MKNMSLEEIKAFLNEAEAKCSYATQGEVNETVLADNTRVLGPYTKDQFTYIDKYKGFAWFSGREEVTKNGKLVWHREYDGGITDEKIKASKKAGKDLYEFLKSALRACPNETPWRRGPDTFKEGELEFIDDCTGDMSEFKGRETITLNGKEVYYMDYWGGTD